VRHHTYSNPSESDDDDEPGEGMQVVFEGKTDQDRYIEMSEINNTQHSINQYTMDIAVNILEKSWLWRFRSAKKKLEMVAEMYHHLTEMI
jgi:hypothetical protein